MATEFFEGSIDLHALQNAMNYYEALNNVNFSAITSIVDPTTATATGTHNFNQATHAPAVGAIKGLLLVAVASGQSLATAQAAQIAVTPLATFAFNAPQIFVSDALKDVVVFRVP